MPNQLNIHGSLNLSVRQINSPEKLAIAAYGIANMSEDEKPLQTITVYYGHTSAEDSPVSKISIRLSTYTAKAQKLLADFTKIVSADAPPSFHRNPHCPQCPFQSDCLNKLKERDCISLLGGITSKVLAKYHKKGIFSVHQLSHLFRPRRRRRGPQTTGHFSWELKALAIREQKTFVLHPPELPTNTIAIYLDFEGLPNEGTHYLLGGVIRQEGEPDQTFSFWADTVDQEPANFSKLVSLLLSYPDAPIYHYGSYEGKALKQAARKWPVIFKKHLPVIEKRLVNLLSFLRSHIYPPTYGNGLKEVASYLGFTWNDADANGLQSIAWRKEWEAYGLEHRKQQLIQYNLDDCNALCKLHNWFIQLATNAMQDNVQQVAEMKRHTPYKLQGNQEYGDDFLVISKAAYFDYQRSKIYWRGEKKSASPLARAQKLAESKNNKKGVATWRPKKANEVIIVPPIKACPHCGHTKLYQSHEPTRTKVMQTDLKFTASGVRQHVVEYQSGRAKCAKCGMKTSNRNLRIMHFGDNFFAYVINLYVTCHISHEMISRMLKEQFNIQVKHMYLVMRKEKWWRRNWQPEIDFVRDIVLASPFIHIDETTIRLNKGSGYVWVLATAHTVFYHFTPTREVGFLQEWLKGYTGIIITDFFPGYETLPVRRQKCLIHLIRDLNDDLYKTPFDDAYKAMVTDFTKLMRSIIATIDRYGLKKKALQKHQRDVDAFYHEFIDAPAKGELMAKYSKRLKKHWNELWTFLGEDNVTWNNNNAEAAVKAFAQHRRGVNGQVNETGLRLYLEMLSIAQTCRYRNLPFLNFLRRKSGLWENIPAAALPGFLPFAQARMYMHRLGFDRKQQWNEWKASGKRPPFIPSSPERTYKDEGWVDWHDWIGFSFLPFPEARTYMRRLGLKNRDEYWAWLGSGNRPKYIPYSPEKVYKHTGWLDLGDWLGTGNKGNQRIPKLTYDQAKAYVQALGITTQQEYFAWRSSGERPSTVPSDPSRSYKELESWGVFLGTGRVAN